MNDNLVEKDLDEHFLDVEKELVKAFQKEKKELQDFRVVCDDTSYPAASSKTTK